MTGRPMRHVLVLALVTLAMNGCGVSRDRDAFLEHVYAQLSGDYQRLASSGASTSESVRAFCAAPGPDSLAVARERFAELALTFARVEWLRLGPVVEGLPVRTSFLLARPRRARPPTARAAAGLG